MGLSAELDQLLQELCTAQQQAQGSKTQVASLQAEKSILLAEVELLKQDKESMLNTVTAFHSTARDDLQLSAAYSECLQALSNCKAQLRTTELEDTSRQQALQQQIQLKVQENEVLNTAVAELKGSVEQIKRTTGHQMELLRQSHSRELHDLQSQLSSLHEQLQRKLKEYEAKCSYVAMDQKANNNLKSRLASMRAEITQLQQERDRLREPLRSPC